MDEEKAQAVEQTMSTLQNLWDQLVNSGVDLGKRIVAAFVIYFIGRYLIRFLNKMVQRMMERRKLDPTVNSFIKSLVNVTLTIVLLIAVAGALGIETTSFAALLASAGVAIGMALSGQLQNFAGGLMMLLFKPYKVGDFIETQGMMGTVKEIQIFQTLILTVDNKVIYIPNGSISSGNLTNYSKMDTRRVDWTIGIEYGEDFNRAKKVVEDLLAADERVLKEPAVNVFLTELADSSVNLSIRAWVKGADYWAVFFAFNENVYAAFNKAGIGFPFPQLTVHQAK